MLDGKQQIKKRKKWKRKEKERGENKEENSYTWTINSQKTWGKMIKSNDGCEEIKNEIRESHDDPGPVMLHSSSQTSIKTTLKRTARGPGLVQVGLLVTAKQHTSRPGGWKETLALSLSGGLPKNSCTNPFSPALNKPLTTRGRPATAAILPSEQEMKSLRRQQEQRMAGSTGEWKTAEMDRRGKERKGVGKRERGGDVLTLISLRMTSIMLPITMRKSKTFQGSLK